MRRWSSPETIPNIGINDSYTYACQQRCKEFFFDNQGNDFEMNILLVFAGGGIGAVARYWMQGIVYRFVNGMFPYGTVAVNVLGCFVIGLLVTGMEDRFMVNPSLRIFMTIGILGGFTTFSSFSFETIALLQEGEVLFGMLNILASIVICLSATYIGVIIGKLF